MILADSRYIDGTIVPQPDGAVVVRRNFPIFVGNPFLYTWKQSDRIDRVAARYLGSSTLWWRIMDANPILQSVGDLRPGLQIRIPRSV